MSWEIVTADAGSGGTQFAGESFSEDATTKFIPASLLAYGPEAATPTRVDTVTPLPARDYNASPQTNHASDTAIAAGSSATLNGTQIGSGKTGRLALVRVSASVPWKAELYTVLNGIQSSKLATWFSTDPPLELPRGYISVAEDVTAGLDAFRVIVTNLDTSQPADLYAMFFWDEE